MPDQAHLNTPEHRRPEVDHRIVADDPTPDELLEESAGILANIPVGNGRDLASLAQTTIVYHHKKHKPLPRALRQQLPPAIVQRVSPGSVLTPEMAIERAKFMLASWHQVLPFFASPGEDRAEIIPPPVTNQMTIR